MGTSDQDGDGDLPTLLMLGTGDPLCAALEEALARYGRPEIFNTDQGSQFTSYAFTSVLREAEVRISMDGRGRWSAYYNTQRPHSGLAGRTPIEAYRRIGQSEHGGHERQPDLA